jgi:hypothetical protein
MSCVVLRWRASWWIKGPLVASVCGMSDVMVLKVLAQTLVSAGLLMGAGANTLRQPTPLTVVQWGSWVCLLSGFYYVVYITCCRQCCYPLGRRGARSTPVQLQPVYMDLPQAPPADVSVADPSRATLLEMTAASVYTYVYGWGLLLFVCLYCLTGLHESSSCWWVVGMLGLSLDDLFSRRVHRPWIAIIISLICASAGSLWWATSGSAAADESIGIILWSVVLPVLSPVIFFSLRSTAWTVSREMGTLIEVAMPFMVVIAISVLLCTTDFDSGFASVFAWPSSKSSHGGRRGGLGRSLSGWVNNTGTLHGGGHAETGAAFMPGWGHGDAATFGEEKWSQVHALLTTQEYLIKSGTHFATLLVTPFLAYYAILSLSNCVLQGYVTEFLSAFMLALSVKYAILFTATTASAFAVATAGACFVFLVLLRRSV